MLLETIVWIVCLGLITYKYDIMLLNSINKMSDDYHFITFNCLIIFFINIFYKTFFFKKKNLNESLIWIMFISTMSISCRNILGKDIATLDYINFSLALLYLIYVYRLLNPKEETFVLLKIIIINLIVLKTFWPTIIYLWPYGVDYPDEFDWTDWPYIKF